MEKIKSIAKKAGVFWFYQQIHSFYIKQTLKNKNAETIFTEIYRNNKWGSNQSASGTGSVLNQTKTVANKLPLLFNDIGIKTILDIPCGDFNWMKDVNLEGMNYFGADIVDELIEKNRKTYQQENITFLQLDLLSDELPKVDIIFCRDCLVHFSFADIRKALQNISRSNSTYLLATTFTAREKNLDIMTGEWRPINLTQNPFFLTTPMKLINEECTEGNGIYIDKSLGLWKIDEIRKSLEIQ